MLPLLRVIALGLTMPSTTTSSINIDLIRATAVIRPIVISIVIDKDSIVMTMMTSRVGAKEPSRNWPGDQGEETGCALALYSSAL